MSQTVDGPFGKICPFAATKYLGAGDVQMISLKMPTPL